MNFGSHLRRLRRDAGLTQVELGRKCGLSDTYINQLETGRTEPPTREVCHTLAGALAAAEPELWKYAFSARLERWLRKEGFKRIPPDLVSTFFDSLNDRK
jgi:transcriptional regulator with XRE-family HTH domain